MIVLEWLGRQVTEVSVNLIMIDRQAELTAVALAEGNRGLGQPYNDRHVGTGGCRERHRYVTEVSVNLINDRQAIEVAVMRKQLSEFRAKAEALIDLIQGWEMHGE